MEISLKKKSITLIVTITGEIDHHTAEEIRGAIDREFELFKIKNILFDFSEVNFMDSSGIGMILGRYKNCEQSGGKVLIAGAPEKIDKIFTMSGIYKIAKPFKNVNDALKSL